MMGRLADQGQLFYRFRLENHVPDDHFLRQVDRFIDFETLRTGLASLYSHTGRPSIDPELMIRMLPVGYLNGIRSETRLCEEVHINLEYRWRSRLGLEGQVPDRSTFSKNRHGRFADGDVLRRVNPEISRLEPVPELQQYPRFYSVKLQAIPTRPPTRGSPASVTRMLIVAALHDGHANVAQEKTVDTTWHDA